MREIKFRAWNKEKEIMVYGNEDDSECYWDGIISSDVDMVNFRLRYTLVSEYIWMQYTGLKDKNDQHGQEIWEGDIRKDVWGRKFKVVYDDDLAAFYGEYMKILSYWRRRNDAKKRRLCCHALEFTSPN